MYRKAIQLWNKEEQDRDDSAESLHQLTNWSNIENEELYGWYHLDQSTVFEKFSKYVSNVVEEPKTSLKYVFLRCWNVSLSTKDSVTSSRSMSLIVHILAIIRNESQSFSVSFVLCNQTIQILDVTRIPLVIYRRDLRHNKRIYSTVHSFDLL